MNIFVLDYHPKRAAQYHCDKHVVKMILESAQMLCTAYYLCDPGRIAVVRAAYPGKFYKKAFPNHPCTQWVMQSASNFHWLSTLALELCREYTIRYYKVHRTQQLLQALHHFPPKLPTRPLTCFALAMPEQYRHPCAVRAYRDYYIGDKRRFATWRTTPPHWWPQEESCTA